MKKKLLRQPNIADSGTTFLFATLFNLVAQMFIAIVAIFVGKNQEMLNLVQVASMVVIQVCVSLAIIMNYSNGVSLGNFKAKWQTLLLSMVVGVTSIFAFALFSGGFDALLKALGYSKESYITLNPFSTVLFLLATIILAPVVEEIIFRSFILKGLSSRINRVVAIILSAFAFSLIHMSPNQTAYQFCFGIALGFIATASGSVLPSIIAHSASNLTAFIVGILSFSPSSIALSSPTLIITFAITTAVFIVGFIFILKMIKKWENPTPSGNVSDEIKSKNQTVSAVVSFIFATVICVYMWITAFLI